MSNKDLLGYKTLPEGDVLEAGTACQFETGDWRSNRPVFHKERCIDCKFCWVYCPDTAVIVKDGKVIGFDYSYCKGCGICAHECPVKGKAIKMVSEKEAKRSEKKGS